MKFKKLKRKNQALEEYGAYVDTSGLLSDKDKEVMKKATQLSFGIAKSISRTYELLLMDTFLHFIDRYSDLPSEELVCGLKTFFETIKEKNDDEEVLIIED